MIGPQPDVVAVDLVDLVAADADGRMVLRVLLDQRAAGVGEDTDIVWVARCAGRSCAWESPEAALRKNGRAPRRMV